MPLNVTNKIIKGTRKDPLLSTLIERILVSSNNRKSGDKKKRSTSGNKRSSKTHRVILPKKNNHGSKSQVFEGIKNLEGLLVPATINSSSGSSAIMEKK
jgi:hypothetical protein